MNESTEKHLEDGIQPLQLSREESENLHTLNMRLTMKKIYCTSQFFL